MPLYTPVQDSDYLTEGTPPAGVKYKPVNGKRYNALLAQIVAGDQIPQDAIDGWGPEATRRLFNQARDQINAGNLPPEKKKAQIDVAAGLVNRELAAVKAPPMLSLQANAAFAQTTINNSANVLEKSNKADFKYADVKQDQITATAQNLLAGKRDEVTGTIKSWGGNSLQAMLNEYRDHLWPDDLKRAQQAMDAIGKPATPGQPGFADQLKTIQSADLRALVQAESDKFIKARAADPKKPADAIRDEINYDFDYRQKEIFGKGIAVYNNATDVYQAQEATFNKQRLAQQAAATPTPAPVVPTKPVPTTVAPSAVVKPDQAGGPLEQTAMKFARDAPATWPKLDNLDGNSLDSLRGIITKQVEADRKSAVNVAQALVDGGDPHRIDEIQNPMMKKIIDRDMKAGESIETITEHLNTEAESRMHFVNQQIDTTTPAATTTQPTQKLAAVRP